MKLADFSVATMLEINGGTANKHLSFAGTPYWMAPEVIDNEDQENESR